MKTSFWFENKLCVSALYYMVKRPFYFDPIKAIRQHQKTILLVIIISFMLVNPYLVCDINGSSAYDIMRITPNLFICINTSESIVNVCTNRNINMICHWYDIFDMDLNHHLNIYNFYMSQLPFFQSHIHP